jgi:protein-S-isoprenylcysteine O-methyltransferase Ste14
MAVSPRWDRDAVGDFTARLVVGLLFLLLSINLLADFARTQRVTGLLFLISEALVVVFTIARRKAASVDRTLAARVVTMLALLGPPLLRSTDRGGLVADQATAILLSVGVLVVISGKIVLGRSFGIVPANRGVVATGPYLFVRHPIYAGYLITHVGFIAAHPTVWNAVVLIVADAAMVIRALYEERVLAEDARYRDYCSRVRWHLVPGVF